MVKMLNYNEDSEIFKEINDQMIGSAMRYYLSDVQDGIISLKNLTECVRDDEIQLFIEKMIEKNMLSECKYFCENRVMEIPE